MCASIYLNIYTTSQKFGHILLISWFFFHFRDVTTNFHPFIDNNQTNWTRLKFRQKGNSSCGELKKLFGTGTQVRVEAPPARWGNVKQEWVWNGLRGAFSQICWGFTTQVNITCSLPSHNSSPMAPRARQQATVSQEAQTGPTLRNWGRYAAERRKKEKEEGIFPEKVLRVKSRPRSRV